MLRKESSENILATVFNSNFCYCLNVQNALYTVHSLPQDAFAVYLRGDDVDGVQVMILISELNDAEEIAGKISFTSEAMKPMNTHHDCNADAIAKSRFILKSHADCG